VKTVRLVAYFTGSCILCSCHAAAAAESPRAEPHAPLVTSDRTPADPAGPTATVGNAASDAAEQFAPASSEGEGYRVSIAAVGEYRVGSAGSVLITLDSVKPYKCNAEYPYRFKVEVSGAATFPQPVVTAAKKSHERTSLEVPFTATAPGALRISGELAFSVCTAEKCVVQKTQLSVVVQVSASN